MTDLFLIPVFLLLIAGGLPILLSGKKGWTWCSLIQGCSGILIILLSLLCIILNETREILQTSLTSFYPIILGVDRLSAIFTLLLGTLALAVSCYTPSYLCHFHGERRKDLLCCLIPLFLGSMYLVLLSRTTFTFLLCWELMAIVSFFLVFIEFEEENTRKAAFFYFAMTQLSTVCIFLSLISLYLITGSFLFPSNISASTLPGAGACILLFLGVAIKAGVIPFHKWLPHAHPAAPSPVSALMSGMMLNTALYMLFREVTQFFAIDINIGILILIFGCLTAVLGVIYAVKEQDLKGLLAYSSIDNTGIILIGIGLYAILTSLGHVDAGMMALLGSLFHAFSHGLFKGLLFLTAGSVNQATGTRNIDELGGLLVRMPWTGGLFFVGVLAISALPPFNGFVGELLIYQALLAGMEQGEPLLQVILLLALSLFGLTGALTAVCFVKAFGLTFLALPRTSKASHAHEVPVMMRIGPAILVIPCVLTGVFSSQILTFLGYPGYLPDLCTLSLLLLGTLAITYAAVYTFASRQTRISITWGCGMNTPTDRMEYTGSGFTEPVVRIFGPLYRTRVDITKQYYDQGNCFVRDGRADLTLMKFFEEYLYIPIARSIDAYAVKIAGLQNGQVDRYVLYVFLTVIALILFIGWLA